MEPRAWVGWGWVARETLERGASGARAEGCLEEGTGEEVGWCAGRPAQLRQSMGTAGAMLDAGEVAGRTGWGGCGVKSWALLQYHEAVGFKQGSHVTRSAFWEVMGGFQERLCL